MNDFFDLPDFDYDGEKKKFIDNMSLLKNMDVECATFYKKWYEVQDYERYISQSSVTKAKIWTPRDIFDEKKTIEDIENLNPTVEFVQDDIDWLMLRIFCSSFEFSQTPGRFLKFVITDGNSENKRYLGTSSISSDVITISDRDRYIGWSPNNKLKGNKRINNSAIGSCIIPMQPFGFNFKTTIS